MSRFRLAVVVLIALLLTACATTPSGRSQFIAVPDAQINEMGATAFQQMRTQQRISTNAAQRRYVQCIGTALVAELEPSWRELPWEFELFEDDSPNAFALPGGKVGVHTGLLNVAKNQHQLAAVIGHELAHVTYRHGAERISQQMGASLAMGAISAYAGGEAASDNTRMALGLLGVGAQVGVLLPFSRKHESEADLAGMRIMADAGFDPAGAAELWRNMQAASGGARPMQFLSTHPDPANRIRDLEQERVRVQPRYEQARAAGKRPNCR